MQSDKSAPFWLSRKFWYAVMATAAFLALAITETVHFSSDQVMTFILALLGITVGGHAATDIGAQIAQAIAGNAKPTLSEAGEEGGDDKA